MKIKSIIRFSTLPALAILALVTALGILGCSDIFSGTSKSKQPAQSLSVEVAGLGDALASGSRAFGDDINISTVVVMAYDSGSQALLGTTGNMTKVGATYVGSISPSSVGSVRFRAYVKDVSGNFLYYGEATEVITALTTALAAPITVAARVTRVAPNFQTDTSKGLPGSAGNYVILAKTGITTTGVTSVTGNMAISPGFSAAITGFTLVPDVTNDFATAVEVLGGGRVYAPNYDSVGGTGGDGLTPGNLTVAVNNMQAAYTDASTRAVPPVNTEIGGAVVEIGGHLIVPGLYNWTGAVTIANDLTLDGGPTDVWILQVAGTLDMAVGVNINLTGGALAQNVYWQAAGAVTIGSGAWMKGNVLGFTSISLLSGAKVTGRLLAQTAVTMIAPIVATP